MTKLQHSLTAAGSVGHSAARRRFVLGACASAAALAFTSAGMGFPSFFTQAFADTPPAGLEGFLLLSRKLTGRTTFDLAVAQRVYDALSKADSEFVANVSALNQWLEAHGGVPSDTVTQALKMDTPKLASTVTATLRAWYLGLVGDAPRVSVVAYERALMFDPVSDVLTIPSYCRDVPFYWTQKPPAVGAPKAA
ncbi:uridylyltransferase [Caballeronia sordidicola]|uniref:Uridylyltransferase n=1 Tax=Caballeronia sordidicola TaxID=196367 RepID=A0A158FYW5_CABSO|nr:sugar dehydrogenase complex small subunit [Caballeronia sordidicola]SAL24559.1 uridylyltransferase [Caballeronia sordidicola]